MASPVSPLLTRITTFEAGAASKTTVNVSVVPDSATDVEPPDSVTVNPAAEAALTLNPMLAQSLSSGDLPPIMRPPAG